MLHITWEAIFRITHKSGWDISITAISELAGMFFAGLFFGAVGIAILFLTKRGHDIGQQEYQYGRRYPTKPWMWKKEWQGTRIFCNTEYGLNYHILFAIFWNLLGVPLSFAMLAGALIERIYILIIPGLFFPYIGFALIRSYITERRKFVTRGIANLEMKNMPARIGNTLKATFNGLENSNEVRSLTIRLICLHLEDVSNGDETNTHENTIWESLISKTANATYIDKQIVVPFSFDIPKDLPSSHWQDNTHAIKWQIRIRPTEDTDASAMEFDIPVMK